MYVQIIDYNKKQVKKEQKKRQPISKSKKIGVATGKKFNFAKPQPTIRQTTGKGGGKTEWYDDVNEQGDVFLNKRPKGY